MDSVFQEKLKRKSDSGLISEIQERITLHWNYRSYVDMPDELLDYGSHIEEIYFKENGLRDIPHELPLKCPNLTNLYLYSNELTQLHPSIGKLKNLTTLDLSRNKLSNLPPELGLATSLQSLDLSSNQLESLPSTIGQLHKLEYLYMVGNRIKSIPSSIRHCRNLVAIYVGVNEIEQIPKELSECSNLKEIYFNDNKIKSIPETFATELLHLDTLNLNNNLLEYLPSVTFRSPTLKISFHDNPSLHHISYILACQINASHSVSKISPIPDPHAFKFANRGCFVPKNGDLRPSYKSNQKSLFLKNGSSYTFHFPSSIRILDSTSLIPSLLELSLRTSYSLVHPKEKRFIRASKDSSAHPTYNVLGGPQPKLGALPNVLQDQLRRWKSLCVQCCAPLFSEMSLSLLRVSFKAEWDRPPEEGLASITFCSETCQKGFQEETSLEVIHLEEGATQSGTL